MSTVVTNKPLLKPLYNLVSSNFQQQQILKLSQSVAPPTLSVFSFKRAAILIGLPLSSLIFYRLSTNAENRRKHRIVFGSITRAAHALTVGMRVGIDYKTSLLFLKKGSKEYITALEKCRRRNGKRFVDLCIRNGGVYVKIGQAFVNLPEVIPVEYAEELQVLQERALRRQKGEVDILFKKYFRNSPEEVFGQFNRIPVAAASLAEVYDAQTKDNQRVAVKIQYYDLRDRYETDIATMKIIFRLFEWFNRDWTMAWMLDELHDDLSLELDFSHEARNAEKCREHLKHLKFIAVPKVYWETTRKRVLTYEFLEGVAINRMDVLQSMNLSLKDIDEKLVFVFAHQIFHDGFVHCDPHFGNIHVRKGQDGTAQIILLDHGLYETLLKEERKLLCELWIATVNNDSEKMRQTAVAVGAPEKDYELFCTFVTMMMLPGTEQYAVPQYAKNWDPGLPYEIQCLALKQEKFMMPNDDEYLNKMNVEQQLEIQQRFKRLMEKKRASLFRILKQMPKTMFLLLRNLNCVRVTLQRHDQNVDRTKIITDICLKALKDNKK